MLHAVQMVDLVKPLRSVEQHGECLCGLGLARDMRVRWAFEEVGQPYDVRLVSFTEMKEPPHLRINPFGQIPTYEDGDLAIFESGAIVFHIAENHSGLLPTDKITRANAISWMFAALNTVEPFIVERDYVKYFEEGKSWQGERFSMVDERVRNRLDQLVAWFGGGDWLVGTFSAADILMIHALRRLEGSGMLEDYPIFVDYIARGLHAPHISAHSRLNMQSLAAALLPTEAADIRIVTTSFRKVRIA